MGSDSGGKLSASTTRLAALVFTDIVGSTLLKSQLGINTYLRLLARHNELFEDSVAECPGGEVIKHTGDGFFAAFPTASDAVRSALIFQSRMRLEHWEPAPLTTRLGIHIGEVVVLDMAGRKDVIGLSADVAARLMSLAIGGQILLTATAFNEARQFVNSSPQILEDAPPLRWMAHGRYLFTGTDEPLDVYEVGIERFSPLKRPADSEKAKRVVPHDQEMTLGWRPAVGLDVPGRPSWQLVRKLGEGGFGEVWLGEHAKLKIRRVFKFCFDAERLRGLKREYTLFRLLRGALGERPDIATLHEVKLDEPPFFLESEHTEGGNLMEWAASRGGVDTLPLSERLELLAKIADAVAAAHSVGVLHKDIKPANILVHERPDGYIEPRLADFGIGVLSDRSRLKAHAVTEMGFTQFTEVSAQSSKTSGTRMYAPPETMLDQPFTIQGDVYSLGVMLYQLAVGNLLKPLAPGWKRDVEDDLLRQDIASMVEGDPARRLASAGQVAQLVRSLDERRAERHHQVKEREARARRQRRWRIIAVSLVVGIVVLMLALIENAFRVKALREEKAKAEEITDFLLETFQSIDPANVDEDTNIISAADLIQNAARGLDHKFAGQPLVKARLQVGLAKVLNALGQRKDADALFEEAYHTRLSKLGQDDPKTLKAMHDHVMAHWRVNRSFADVDPIFQKLMERQGKVLAKDDPEIFTTRADYASVLRSSKNRRAKAEQYFTNAIEGLTRVCGPDHPATLNALHSYAWYLNRQNKNREAEQIFKQVLDARRRTLGDKHPDTLRSISTYARYLHLHGDLNEALERAAEAASLRRQVLGEENRSTLYSTLSQARILMDLDRPDEAEPLLEKCVDIWRRTQGQTRHTYRAMAYYAKALHAMGKSAEAENIYKKAIAGLRNVAGDTYRGTMMALANYGSMLNDLGRPVEAESICREAVTTLRQQQGEDHRDTLAATVQYADVLASLSRYDDAEKLYRKASTITASSLGKDHPLTRRYAQKLQDYLAKRSRSGEAIQP